MGIGVYRTQHQQIAKSVRKGTNHGQAAIDALRLADTLLHKLEIIKGGAEPPVYLCNRSACRAEGATYWNTSTRAYYCEKCANSINDHAGTKITGVPLCIPLTSMPLPWVLGAPYHKEHMKEQESVNLDNISIGDFIEYRSGWIANVFDITDITWLGEIGKKRASARIWSRAEGREWYHTHRSDGYSTSDREADIMRIVPAKNDGIKGGEV